ncbi:MAG: hypothetical protein ABW090_01045 [Sedimenticola sp.]
MTHLECYKQYRLKDCTEDGVEQVRHAVEEFAQTFDLPGDLYWCEHVCWRILQMIDVIEEIGDEQDMHVADSWREEAEHLLASVPFLESLGVRVRRKNEMSNRRHNVQHPLYGMLRCGISSRDPSVEDESDSDFNNEARYTQLITHLFLLWRDLKAQTSPSFLASINHRVRMLGTSTCASVLSKMPAVPLDRKAYWQTLEVLAKKFNGAQK